MKQPYKIKIQTEPDCIIELGIHETSLSNHNFDPITKKCIKCPLKVTEAYFQMLKTKGIIK